MSSADMKTLAKIAVTVLVVMAVVNRVPKLKQIIG
jgi:hypothetical protein